MIQSFQIQTDKTVLADLRQRLQQTRWPDEMTGQAWQYGVEESYLKSLLHEWGTNFDWRNWEAKINAWPQFIATIDGYTIHFLHIKSKAAKATPMIITHGWPGSFVEFLEIIPLLTNDDDVSFDLIIPSLLGFGFSGKYNHAGINGALMAGLWVKLMQELGYEKFVTQGGDFGAILSTHIALKYPEHLLGLHLNYIPFNYQPYLPPGEELTKEETAAKEKISQFFMKEGAYSMIQGTKPQSLAYGLMDAPAGLAAWILQIFKSFSDPKAALDELFDPQQLLAHITLYWITETIGSSMRLYVEMQKEPFNFGENDFIHTPTGIAHYTFPEGFPARKFVERGYNVVYWNDLPKGGHFAAMEEPQLFAEDVKAFAKSIL